jgi:DNA-binding LacI/PurR family transcriptional regulator
LQPVLLPADGGRGDRIAQYLGAGHVDGAIVILQHEISDIVGSLHGVAIPIVYVGRPVSDTDESGDMFVDSDNYGGGRLAVRALLEAGRRTIATIAGPSDMQAAVDRLRGWHDELAAWGVPEGPTTHGDFTMQGGTAAMTRLLSRAPQLDAVFAASDLMAVGALRVLQASGRSVPGDVSMIGFDDTLVASTAEPPLSSVRQPLEQMGRSAAELLIELIERPSNGRHEVLPTALVTRESV